MKPDALKEAIAEAERFLVRAKALLDHQDAPGAVWFWGNEKTAAVRRSSMDLTKSLARLRRRAT